MIRRPPISNLLGTTTLFRSDERLPAGIGRLADLRGRTLATAAALPRATEYRAATWRTRRSAAEPCPLWSIAPCAINVLPLKAQVEDRETRSPTPHHTLKFEITFCVRGVLSPLLSNIMLDELDRELERRGHRYVRYADDCNIYVRSERAGQRVMMSITRFITQRLKLKVNETKSAVARPQERKFLGFSFTSDPEIRRAIAPKALTRFKDKIREITRQAKGVSIETTVKRLATYMVGWRGYFGFCETPEVLIGLVRWVRLRLRCALWRQWKTPRRRRAALLQLGVRPRLAGVYCESESRTYKRSEEHTSELQSLRHLV